MGDEETPDAPKDAEAGDAAAEGGAEGKGGEAATAAAAKKKKKCGCGVKVGPEADAEGESPIKDKRKCRDVICVLLFGAFWMGMFVIALVAKAKGDPMRLLKGTDFKGDVCGGAEHGLRPLVYFPRLNQDLMEALQKGASPMDVTFYGLCVRKCPAPDTMVCRYGEAEELASLGLDDDGAFDWAAKKEDRFSSRGPCWYVPLGSKVTLSRCLPSPAGNVTAIKRCARPKNEGGGFYAYDARLALLNNTDLAERYVFYKSNDGKRCAADPFRPVCYEPNEKCKTSVIQTVSFAKRPTQPNPLVDKLMAAGAMVGRWFGDLRNTGGVIMVNGGMMAVVFGFGFLMLMKYCAGLVVWVTVASVVLMLALTTLFFASKAGLLDEYADQLPPGALDDAMAAQGGALDESAAMDAEAEANKIKSYTTYTYVAGLLTAVLTLIIIAMRKKIKITIGIIRAASNAVKAMPSLIVFPLIPFLMLVVLLGYWLLVAAGIASADGISLGDVQGAAAAAKGMAASAAASGMAAASAATGVDLGNATSALLAAVNGTGAGGANNETVPSFVGAAQVSPDKVMRAVQAYHFFGLLWTNNLINAISMCTIAGAVSRYYWKAHSLFPVAGAFYNCFRFHFGSLCFGSLIIAIVQFVRACLAYLDSKTKALQDKNKALKVAFKVVQVCMYCVEKVLKFISKNAYIMIAMKGKSFCGATFEAFGLLFANLAQVGLVTMISSLLLLLARIAITACCAMITFKTLTSDPLYAKGGDKELSSPMVPVLVTTLLAFFVATTFMNVYGMAIDTILLCFCEDKKVNGPAGPYYMSDELKRYIGAVGKDAKGGDDDGDDAKGGAKEEGGGGGEENKDDGGGGE